MKIRLKVAASIDDNGVIKAGEKGDVLEVSESTAKWEIAAGRASEATAEEPKKKD